MYQIVNETSVKHLPSGAVFPVPAVESFGFAYQAWLDAGNVPEPAEVVPISNIPSEVTMRQARLALHAAGKLSLVESAIEALPEPPKTAARIEWEYSNSVQRHNGFVSQIAPLIGMTESEIDSLFIQAATL